MLPFTCTLPCICQEHEYGQIDARELFLGPAPACSVSSLFYPSLNFVPFRYLISAKTAQTMCSKNCGKTSRCAYALLFNIVRFCSVCSDLFFFSRRFLAFLCPATGPRRSRPSFSGCLLRTCISKSSAVCLCACRKLKLRVTMKQPCIGSGCASLLQGEVRLGKDPPAMDS